MRTGGISATTKTSFFTSHDFAEIRNTESASKSQIEDKKDLPLKKKWHFDLFPKTINEQLNQSKNENDLLNT